MKRLFLLTLLLTLGLVTACSLTPAGTMMERESESETGMGMAREMMGSGMGMMARHMAPIEAEYAGLTNPIPAGEESLKRGQEIYTASCASCHGDGGMGDGPAGAVLDPAPAPVAHTSQMMGDDYLFWRISEGGAEAPFNSVMPSWKGVLDEQSRWDVINYVRALGSGQVMPGRGVGGALFDPEVEAASQAEMLAQGVEQGVISQAEADTFDKVHAALDAYRRTMPGTSSGSMVEMRDMMLSELANAGEITQAEADAFVDIHDRLVETGLMQ